MSSCWSCFPGWCHSPTSDVTGELKADRASASAGNANATKRRRRSNTRYNNSLIQEHQDPNDPSEDIVYPHGGVNASTEYSTDTSSPKEVDGGVWHVVQTGSWDDADYSRGSSPDWNVKPGDTAVPIVLHSLVGRGSYGKVYKGTCGRNLVAVKVIPHHITAIEKITREVKVMLALNHPNIIRALSYVCWERLDDGGKLSDEDTAAQTWIVQEFCDSGSLSQVIKEGRLHDLEGKDLRMIIIIDLLEEIARALHYMHRRKVLHGDLKCSNVMMCQTHMGLVAKVGDFGLSRTLLDETHLNTTSLGTITHMSPEMLRCGHMSYMADMYAFGMIMYEMLTTNKPYQGMMQAMVIEKVLVAGELPKIPKDMPQKYVGIMRQCWKFIAKERPTFADMLIYLQELRVEATRSSVDGRPMRVPNLLRNT